jgi:hypothetical protein
MYNKDTKDYLEVLRTRGVRPPFEQMASLIANAPLRNVSAIPLFAKFAGALLLGGIIASGAWVLSAKFHATDVPTSTNRVNASAFYPSHVTHESYGSQTTQQNNKNRSKLKIISQANFTEPEGSVLHDCQPSSVIHTMDDDNTTPPLHPCAIREQAASLQPVASDTPPISPITIPSSNQESTGNFFTTLGGVISRQFNAPFQQTSFSDAFLGVGYGFSTHSSVRVLAGEEVFSAPSRTTTNSISFHDTTFVHDGQTYQNVLGEIQSVTPPLLTRIYWLGASYRYTMGHLSNTVRPFAEVMAGGSTDGFLTHQSLGAEFTATSSIDLDLLLEASELVPQNSGWLTKAGFSAAMEYRW